MKKLSCIIPAYNEGARIANVLRAVIGHPLVDEVIVVNDASTDNTLAVLSEFSGITLINLPKNGGKSKAICAGIEAASGEYLLFLDADLVGLTGGNIADLIRPVLAGEADVSISLRRNAPAPWHWIGIDYISGERVFRKGLIAGRVEEISKLANFGLEVFFNQIIIARKCRISVVKWDAVDSPYKGQKLGLSKGPLSALSAEIPMMRDIFRTVSPFGALRQIIAMRSSRVTNHKISLVIPAYNEEKYIVGCLENVIKYAGSRLHEIIVIDNASTDRTSEVSRQFPGVRVVREEQKGLVKARQRGYLEATGNIIAFTDADTRITERWLDTIVSEFDANPSLAVLSGPSKYFDTTKFQQVLSSVYWNALAMPVYFVVGYMAYGANFSIRKDVIEKMGGFDTSIEFYGEDTNIARRASKHGKVKFKPGFWLYASARRAKGEGLFTMANTYMINFVSEVVIKRPVTKEYKDFR